MMDETLSLALSLAAGILLGAIFFGGLWWTVRHGVLSGHPGLWFVGSMLLRITIVMTGFYFLLGLPGDGWKILLIGSLGFFMARLAATKFLPAPLHALLPPIRHAGKPSAEKSARGNNHAL
jgi:F1F0 ATPase subunit 2